MPFASHYRPVWMALGIVAFYLGIAIGISTWLRPRIGYSWWRRLHVLTLGIFLLATVHGIATGSDTQTWWALGIYVVSSAVVGSLLLRRVLVQKAEKRKHALAQTAASARRVNAAPHNSPRPLSGDRVAAIQRTSQKRADVVRMR